MCIRDSPNFSAVVSELSFLLDFSVPDIFTLAKSPGYTIRFLSISKMVLSGKCRTCVQLRIFRKSILWLLDTFIPHGRGVFTRIVRYIQKLTNKRSLQLFISSVWAFFPSCLLYTSPSPRDRTR